MSTKTGLGEVNDVRAWFSSELEKKISSHLGQWISSLAIAILSYRVRTPEQIIQGLAPLQLPATGLASEANENLKRTLNFLSLDVGAFQAECQTALAAGDLLEGSLRVVRENPIWRIGVNAYLPISTLLLGEAALEVPVNRTSATRRESVSRFGPVLESYIHAVLDFHFGDRYEPLIESSAQGEKRCDGVIWYPGGVVLVECKASRVPESKRYASRSNQDLVSDLSKSKIIDAVLQLQSTVEQLTSRAIPVRTGTTLRIVGSLIVSWQDLPNHLVARTVLKEVLPATREATGLTVLRPQIISVAGVEDLGLWSLHPLLDTLAAKMSNESSSYSTLRNFYYYRNIQPGQDRLREHLLTGLHQLATPSSVHSEERYGNNAVNESIHFSNLRVRGFRRLAEVDIQLRPVCVMIGANGSGKTSMLELISLLAASGAARMADWFTRMGGMETVLTLPKSTTTGPSALDLSLSAIAGSARLTYQLTLTRPKRGLYYLESETLLSETEGLKYVRSEVGTVHYLDTVAQRTITPNWEYDPFETALSQVPRNFQQAEAFRKTLASTVYYTPIDVSAGSPIRTPQAMRPVDLPGARGDDLVSYLYYLRETDKDAFEVIEDTVRAGFPDFLRFDFPPVAAGLLSLTWRDRQFTQPLYVGQLSEGTLRFIWLCSLLLSRNLPSITLLDEPEMSLHPELLRLLADLFRSASESTQLFVATHSDCLVGFLRPEEVLIADLEDGATHLNWADHIDNIEQWLHDYTLDNLWELGKLGGRS
jgi:predicted ATPase